MAPERSLYSDEVMDHFLHPRNSGDLKDATLEIEQVNDVCGDNIVLAVRLEAGKIIDAAFRSLGCAVAVATASMVTEAIKGKTPEQAEESVEGVLRRVRKGTAEDKSHCSNMVEQVWKKTLAAIRALGKQAG